MTRPDDAAFRVRIETFVLVRRLLPIVFLAGSLVVPVFVVDPSTGVWISLGLFGATLFVIRTLNDLPLYPAHTFGLEYRTEDESFGGERRRCLRCEEVTEDGVHRRYARQLVVLGVPLYTLAWGSNDFCGDRLEADSNSNAESRSTPTDSGAAVQRESAAEPNTARRVDRHDETTALEVRRAFDEE